MTIPKWLLEQFNGDAKAALAVMRGWAEVKRIESANDSNLESFEVDYR